MNVINKKFAANKKHFLIQSILILLFMAAVLFPLGSLEQSVVTAIGASTLASSIFTVFVVPNSSVARISRILGGYFIGIVNGLFWHFVFLHTTHAMVQTMLQHTIAMDLCGAISVSSAIFIMVIFDYIHPPSAGLSLALVIGPWNLWTIVIVVIAIIVLCLIKYWLRNWFINLL